MKKNTQDQWQQKLKDLDKVADGLGLGIDAGVKETVALLNLAGVHTTASCEGHKNWGFPYPWIDIGRPDAWGIYKKLHKVKDFESKEFKDLTDQITKLNQPECEKLFRLLKQFYPGNNTSATAMLIISPFGHGAGRLESRQEYIYESDKRAYARHARLAKAEMKRFTEFLKQQMLA